MQPSCALACAGLLATLAAAGVRAEEPAAPARPGYSPYAGQTHPTRVFFGDTHLHTSFSMDAGAFGCRLGPRDAYRFARGEEVTASGGLRARLSRPLDFLVVADHSDNMGFFPDLFAGKPEVLAEPLGRRWYDLMKAGKGAEAAVDIITTFTSGRFPKALVYQPGTPAYRSAWKATIDAAEEANAAGLFTAFIGYEWTSTTAGNNLHRNVVFRDGGDRAGQLEPYTTLAPLGSDDPRELWKWMHRYEAKTGGRVLAIAHNGNLSNGRMFPIVESFTGKPVDRAYAEERARWERLYEATQIKGDGETHPFLSPNDEFAAWERWDKGNLDMSEAKTPQMLEFEYVRSALGNGLALEQRLGVNPYKFGLVGSTDSHTALATAEEANYFSKSTSSEPSPTRWEHAFVQGKAGAILGWEMVASGYAAVWASDNTREALWDAMQRRETYATTGPRMTVRFFGGFDFAPADATSGRLAEIGYAKGVPMGGDLSRALAGKAPSFLVSAQKDPLSGNLDRIQIIKVWTDADGGRQERIHDVAVSDGRAIDAAGRCRTPVGDTVDVGSATWTNAIGDVELAAVWNDPAFDPQQRAVYYARVIEIPTPRWTAYDAKRFGVAMPTEVPMTAQDRAYTSPIWYTPGT
jgi:hypothetical protein